MLDVEQLIKTIDILSRDYKPSPQTEHALQQRIVVAVLGPFGVGKSTLMKMVEQIDPSFGYVLGITTRPPRPGEADTYRFIKHDIGNRSRIVSQLQSGELVQVTTHPITKYVYGSDLISYAKPNNILDIFSTYLDEFAKLPFKDLKKAYLVVPPDQWSKRIAEREKIHSAEEIRQRWIEAKVNLEWGLANAEQINWVVNDDGNQELCARQLIDLGRNQGQANKSGPEIAKQMLMMAEATLNP